ncbi:MAG: hypothetical protein WCO00_04510 [Rhodospirillaceae bacterium]
MSILETLEFSDFSKKAEKGTPHLALRNRLISAIDEQIAGANAEQNNEHYVREVQKAVKNAETGDKEIRTIQKQLRKMWWKSANGILLEIRFANKVLKIGNKSSVIIGEFPNLVPVLKKIQDATRNGELDEVMKQALAGRKRKTGKADTEVAPPANVKSAVKAVK